MQSFIKDYFLFDKCLGFIVTQKLGLHHIIERRQCRDKFRESFDNMITEKPSDPSIMSFATIIFWQTYDLTLQLDSQVHYKLSLVSVRTIG